MRVLVTGGTGFVGQHLLALIRERAWDVTSVQRGIPDQPVSGVRYAALDLQDPEATRSVLAPLHPQLVFHLAGRIAAGASLDQLLVSNVLATKSLLDALAAAELRVRIVLVGSAAEYGPVTESELPVTEKQREQPVGIYGISKLAQGLLGHAAHVVGGVELLRVRPFNITGPGEPAGQVAGAFAAQIAAIERGDRPRIIRTGPLSPRRDFLDVRDVARALVAVAERGEAGRIYNVCSGTPTAIREILDILLSEAGVSCDVEESGTVSAGVSSMYGSADLIAGHTGWKAMIPLRRSLAELLEYSRRAAAA